jgi:hypothetical protein
MDKIDEDEEERLDAYDINPRSQDIGNSIRSPDSSRASNYI